MNTYPHLNNPRSSLADEFSRLQARAARSSLWHQWNGRNARLEVFPEMAPEKSPNRRFLGEKEIPLEQVIGTLNRQDDFDAQFRPLKRSLRDRWVNARLSLERDGWEPILVHRVGDRYYVEDGHHRVSVARWLGMAFVVAKIWEYPVQGEISGKGEPAACPEVCQGALYPGWAD